MVQVIPDASVTLEYAALSNHKLTGEVPGLHSAVRLIPWKATVGAVVSTMLQVAEVETVFPLPSVAVNVTNALSVIPHPAVKAV